MNVSIKGWVWRGQQIFTCFCTSYQRRLYRRARRFVFAPTGPTTMEDLTAEEVGQLLGGN